MGCYLLASDIGEVFELSMFSIVPEKSGKSNGEAAKAAESVTASEQQAAKGVKPIEAVRPVVPEGGLGAQVVALVKYMAKTEVHTYAFSVAANAILSLFPFIVLLLTVSRRVFHSRAIEGVVADFMRSFLPTGQDFVIRNMQVLANPRKGTQIFSVVMLLVTSTGVFLPLEVALNSVWGVTKNRSYVHNQVVSLGLALAVGVLAMVSVASTAGQNTSAGVGVSWAYEQCGLPGCRAWGDAILCAGGEYAAVLPDLLGAAVPEDSGAGGAADGDCDRVAVAGGEVSLCAGAAAAGFSGGLWAVLYFGWADDVGVFVGTVAAGGGALLGDAVYVAARARGGEGRGGAKTVDGDADTGNRSWTARGGGRRRVRRVRPSGWGFGSLRSGCLGWCRGG